MWLVCGENVPSVIHFLRNSCLHVYTLFVFKLLKSCHIINIKKLIILQNKIIIFFFFSSQLTMKKAFNISRHNLVLNNKEFLSFPALSCKFAWQITSTHISWYQTNTPNQDPREIINREAVEARERTENFQT